MGTLDYMAPEQLEDSHLVGPRADIYALAGTLFRLLTGSAPFAKEARKTPLQKLRALATETAPPIRERRADLPEELAAIIDRALRREPTERFESMAEFAAALAPWCAGQDLAALARTASERVVAPVGQVFNLPVPKSPNSSSPVQSAEHASVLAGQVENLPHVPPRRHTLVIALLTLVGFIAFGVVIVLQTNNGKLIIESARDGVEVRIKKSGRVVEQFEVAKTAQSTKLAAGEYEIELVGDADGLKLDQHKIVLTRGDVVVAKVTEVPIDQAIVNKPKRTEPDLPAESRPSKPVEIVDRTAKGMETFEATNPDVAGEKLVREVLQKNITVDFAGLPLTDVLQVLEDKTQIVFFIDNEAITEEGIAPDTPITLSLTDKPGTTVLEFLLRPIQLAWYLDRGQVFITTA